MAAPRFNPVRRGMGAGSPQAQQIAAGAEQAASGGFAVAAAAGASLGPAAPIALAVIGIAALIAHFVGGGCGQACIIAAKAEQIYEAAADNLLAVGKLGMITAEEAVAGMQLFIQGGVQHEAALGNTSQEQAGAKHLTEVIQNEIAAAQSLPSTRSAPLDLTRAAAAFLQPGAAGWYPDALGPAEQLTLAYLQGLPAGGGPRTLPGSTAPDTGLVAQVGGVLSSVADSVSSALGLTPGSAVVVPYPSPVVLLVVVGAGIWLISTLGSRN